MRDLLSVLAQLESSDRPWVQRFEPATHARVVGGRYLVSMRRCREANDVSTATAQVYTAMSHGLFQLMGFVIYGDLSFRGTLFDFLSNRALQVEMAETFLRRKGIAFDVRDILTNPQIADEFADRYNGPGNNVEYLNRFRAVATRLGFA